MTGAKIAIIGVGFIGSTVAFQLAHQDVCDEIVLLDQKEKFAAGHASDIQQSLTTSKTKVSAASHYKDIGDSHIVFITAGKPRAPNMSRLDLMNNNKDIVANIARKVAEYVPNSSIITVTNPTDVMNYVAWKSSGFDKDRIVGNGSNLDSMRLKRILSRHYQADYHDIAAMAIGEHGAHQTPLFNQTRVNGDPLKLTEPEMSRLREELLMSADKIIDAKGATQFAPASSMVELALTMIDDSQNPYPCSTILSGEYGYSDISIGAPVIFKKRRVERVLEVKLNAYEKEIFMEGAEKLKKICQGLGI